MDTEGSNDSLKMNTTTESKDVEVKPSEPSRRNSKGDKLRKKDDKSVEQVLKALNSLETTEEKLAAMCKKYADIVDENRKLQLAAKQCEKKCCILQREKEQIQTEHSKAVLSRSRLESLCRELQRQNKAIKEESLLKVREEEEKRKVVSAKFQGTLNEITTLMQQNIEKNAKLKEENVEMAQRFGKLLEQYEIREQQVEKLLEQIHIETELGEAKMAKARMEMANERESMLREKKQLLMDLEECRGKIRVLQEGEVGLRGQIRLYTDKYDEFQTALTRSSEVFNGFKGEMEKMSKKICKLEKETTSWKQRWERSHQALLEMAADKQQRDGELALANRRLTQMQALCRTLQAERSALLAQLRGKSDGDKDSGKEENDGNKLNEEAKDSTGVTLEVIENDIIAEIKTLDATEGKSALPIPYEIEKVSDDIGDEKQDSEKTSATITGDLNDAIINNSVSLSGEITAAVSEFKETSVFNIPEKDGILSEMISSHVLLNTDANESIKIDGQKNQPLEKPDVENEPSLPTSVSSDVCVELEKMKLCADENSSAKELELLETQLNSCRLSGHQASENEINSEQNNGEPFTEKSECQDTKTNISGVCNNNVEGSELSVADSSSIEDSNCPQEVCTENQMKKDEKEVEDGNSGNLSKQALTQIETTEKVNEEKGLEKGNDSHDVVTGCEESLDKSSSKVTLEASNDDCKVDAEEEAKGKSIEKVTTASGASKKSESVPINMKKSKESSRKRKR